MENNEVPQEYVDVILAAKHLIAMTLVCEVLSEKFPDTIEGLLLQKLSGMEPIPSWLSGQIVTLIERVGKICGFSLDNPPGISELMVWGAESFIREIELAFEKQPGKIQLNELLDKLQNLLRTMDRLTSLHDEPGHKFLIENVQRLIDENQELDLSLWQDAMDGAFDD